LRYAARSASSSAASEAGFFGFTRAGSFLPRLAAFHSSTSTPCASSFARLALN
jgi:hypothetical protein